MNRRETTAQHRPNPAHPRQSALRNARAGLDLARRIGENGKGALGFELVRIIDVKPERIEWCWDQRIAQGKLCGIAGNAGLGKSTLMLDIAARVTGGVAMPDGSSIRPPEPVIILSAEDGIADTIRPRLEAAGADLELVSILTAAVKRDKKEYPVLPEHLPALRGAICETGARLVIIDPWTAFLSSGVNSWNDHSSRRALAPVAELAEETRAAVCLVCHLNKDTSKLPLHRLSSSVGLGAALRMVMLVAPDPEDEDRRVLAMLKTNLAKPAASLAYRLVSVQGQDVARVAWEGECRHSASDILTVLDSDERADRQEAREFLLSALADGRQPTKEILSQARMAGLSERTMRRAKADLGLQKEREGFGKSGTWYWRLPHATEDAVYADSVAAYGDQNPESPHTTSVPPLAAKSEEVGSLCETADAPTTSGDGGPIGCQPQADTGDGWEEGEI